ncbi:U3 small nucleolar RNA-associated protein 8 [Spathaspora sp. JA1]|nr:U3 small nucleolar RNA-associated protein 8 [Spathaspora sp. JA1]
MSKPTLFNQYPITTLPRIPDLDLVQKVVIPGISSIDTSIIDLGISKSTISSHIIKPTPKLVWSHALSPSSVVDCMDVISVESVKYYAVGITERKKSKLLILEVTATDEASESSTSNTSKEIEMKLESKIVGIKFMKSSENLVIAYENGSVELVKFSNGELTLDENRLKGTNTKNEVILFAHFIQDLEDSLLLIVSKKKAELNYKLIAVNPTRPILEVASGTKSCGSKPASFCYNSGILYQYHDKKIDSINITNFNTIRTISVESLVEEDSEVSIQSPALDRILLGHSNMLYLINFKYSALLASFKSSANSSHPIPDKVFINQVVPVKGNSQNTISSMAIYLNLRNKNNNVYLNVIDLNVGFNKLNECLGKSLDIQKTELHDLVDLIKLTEQGESNGTINTTDEVTEVYQYLKQAQEEKDLNKWESVLIPYLKKKKSLESLRTIINNKEWEHLPSNKVYRFKEFDVDRDCIVDINFIDAVLSLILTSDGSKLSYIDEEFVPEYTLMYLLTNPIFPKKYTTGLIQLFNQSHNFTLLRQAINTCANIPCFDLLTQLVNTNTDKLTLNDLVNRLIGEFSRQEITQCFKSILESNKQETQVTTTTSTEEGEEEQEQQPHQVINLVEITNRILELKGHNSWFMIEIIIDVAGLFNWTSENINDLNKIITGKIEALTINSYNLTLVNQVVSLTQKSKNKSSNKKLLQNDQPATQLDSILTMSNQNSNKKLDETAIEIAQRVPNYSIETLEI